VCGPEVYTDVIIAARRPDMPIRANPQMPIVVTPIVASRGLHKIFQAEVVSTPWGGGLIRIWNTVQIVRACFEN